MKKIIISLVLTLSVLRATADVFVAPSTELVFLTVPTNQTMLISSVKLGDFGGLSYGYYLYGLLVTDGVTNLFLINGPSASVSSGPYAFTGPCQIAFIGDQFSLSPAPVVVSYNRLSNSPLYSLIAAPNSTNTIPVPAGKCVRFLTPTSFGGMSAGYAAFQSGTNTVFSTEINNGDEFSGPVTITISNPSYTSVSQIFSYYFTDNFFAMPETGCISGPTGSFEIAVEKSGDLNAWSPVVVYNTGSDQKAFYRLRIQK